MSATAQQWTLKYEPRSWQVKALRLWNVDQRGIVRVVTGGGKTVFAEMCMIAFRDRSPKGRIIILVPTISLLDQWFVSLQDELGVPKDEIGCYSFQEKTSRPKPINLLVINSARAVASKFARGADIFLIVDECHRAGSPANSLALKIAPKATLGLSATPERESDDGFDTRIAPALGSIIFKYDYAEAYRDGVISPFELINIRIDMLADEQAKYSRLTKRAASESQRLKKHGGSEEQLRRILQSRAAVSATAAMRTPVAAKLVEQNRGKRTILFHERISAANKLLDILNVREHCATIYHSQIGPSLRRDNLRLYRQGVFDALITCRALDEGMNVPETTVAIIASCTSSERQRIQRLGRVLRPAPGKKHATIYTIYATDTEERRLREEEESLSGVASVSWRRGFAKSHG
jgi:superfamily II DNA or RNA helicase